MCHTLNSVVPPSSVADGGLWHENAGVHYFEPLDTVIMIYYSTLCTCASAVYFMDR